MNTDKMRRALEIGLDAAIEIANAFHVSHKGYKEDRHEQLDDDVKEIQDVLTALSQSEPQVSQPVAEICSGFALHWVGSGAIAPIIEKHNLKVGDNLFSSPPDYEALKAQLVRSEADNTRLQSQYDEMRLKCSRRPAVAENEALKAENVRLQSECDRLKEELNAWKIGFGSKAK